VPKGPRRVGSVKAFPAPSLPQAPSLPVDLASGLAQYGATEPVSTRPTTTTNASHVAPGTTEAGAFPSPSRADTSKDEAHHWTT